MTTNEIISVVLAALAFVLSVVAFWRSDAVARGMIELDVKDMITKTRDRVSDISILMLPLTSKETKSVEESKSLQGLEHIFREAIESNINAYEEACAKYLDRRIDRKRFRKNYQIEIRQLVENPAYKQYFDGVTSRYKAILKVYNGWENLEK